MSVIGRTWSIGKSLSKITLAGLCATPITVGILFVLTAFSNGSLDVDTLGLPAGIIGGAISGYLWGKFFGKLESKQYRAMMKKQKIDVHY